MLFDFIIINKGSRTPIYYQIYENIKTAIENGSLKKGNQLPSIRKLCNDLSISKTTVENAYNQLCVEGYIKNVPQKGYYVEAQLNINRNTPLNTKTVESSNKNLIKFKYDFGGRSIESSSNIKDWKKAVRDTLNKDYLLKSYGETQGELNLRQALVKYSFSVRGVNSNEENIVIGSGTQSLLYILCGILGTKKRIAIEQGTYTQAEQIFRDFDYDIQYFTSDKKGPSIDSLKSINPEIVLINPNFNSNSGMNTTIERRIELIKYCEKNNCLIIEDDYNGELRYTTHPIPCIQSYDSNNTIYIGSFSKILIPAVRMSYMVLSPAVCKLYNERCKNYNQTSSKIEQLALADYIREGKLEKHLRKVRRTYAQRSKTTIECIKNIFGSKTKLLFNETSLYISINTGKIKNLQDFFKKCESSGIKLMSNKNKDYEFSISFSGISTTDIENGISEIEKLI